LHSPDGESLQIRLYIQNSRGESRVARRVRKVGRGIRMSLFNGGRRSAH